MAGACSYTGRCGRCVVYTVNDFGTLLDCMQGKLFTGVFTKYGRRVRVSVKIRVRFRFICVGDPTCSHSLAV